MKQVGNAMMLTGKDVAESSAAKGMMLRYVESKREETGDPTWGTTDVQRKEALDFATKSLAATAKAAVVGIDSKASDRLIKALDKAG